MKIYKPQTVVKALENNYCESYWTNTGAMDEVSQYLKYNVLEIRDDVIQMVAGEEIDIIKEKEYIQKFKVENEGKEVLAVAICYDSKSKEHHCKIEAI